MLTRNLNAFIIGALYAVGVAWIVWVCLAWAPAVFAAKSLIARIFWPAVLLAPGIIPIAIAELERMDFIKGWSEEQHW